jgi:sigma-B regulation protein RsbU (phosphoserine phosphatase)
MVSYYQPLEKISGDFFDIIELPDGSLGIIIVDVSGHGIPAALITIMMKFLISSYGPEYASPDELLKKMNGELSKVIKTGDYVTAFYVIIGPDNILRHSNAGHNCALLHRKTINDISELYGEGLFLGLVDNDTVKYDVYELQLENGDRVILYTDGITEQQNTGGEMYGIDRFYEVIMDNIHRESQDLMNFIINDLKEFSNGAPQNDDTTLLIVDINNRKQ